MPKTIALVEDDAAIRENYIMALKAQGYSVNAYEDRPSAAEAVSVWPLAISLRASVAF